MKRDPHLPPPEVCDWLLGRKWSAPSTVKVSSDHHDGETYECCEACAAIGANGMIDLLLPTIELQILQEDAAARQANAYEARGQAPEDPYPEEVLADQICKTIAKSEIETSTIAAAGAAFTAGILMIANHYGVKFEAAEDLES
jgi:hypothetical protein